MTWRVLSLFLWLASALLVGMTLAVAWIVPPWLEREYARRETSSVPAPNAVVALPQEALAKPTAEEIVSAASARLTRMDIAKPPPPPEAAPPPMPPAVPPVQVPLFAGTLIGTIDDSDPSLSYAILRWPDSRVQLVSAGDSLSESPESPKVESIQHGTVLLRRGDQVQSLEVSSQ